MTGLYRIPDSIIGVGGAGKEIVEQFMQKEYILDEVLRPREDTSVERRELRAFTVDTDTEAEGEDRATENRINTLIDETANEYDRPVGEDRVEYNYINVVEETDRMRIQPENLVRKPNVPEIAENSGLSCWWLRESDHMIGVSDNYTNGVNRRRGLSKALLHASQLGRDPIKDIVDQASTADHCAVVVGIGGGTGSGMFLDIAKQLQNEGTDNISLFAILPKLGEGDNEKSNSFAALSELERLALDNKNPFRNIVLLPYEPAANAAEFDDAVIQTILSYYNVDNSPSELDTGAQGLDKFLDDYDESNQGAAPKYAPFTVAIPQKLYYAAEEVIESRDTISNFIENKREAIEAEDELYDAIEDFVDEYCADEIGEKLTGEGSLSSETLTRQQSTDLREQRVSPLKELLSLKAFDQLGYDSAGKILEQIENIEREIESRHDDIEDTERLWALKLEKIPGVDEAAVVPQEDHMTIEQDEIFAELILDELRLIGRRRDLLKTTNLIEDPIIKQGIESALDENITGVAGTRPEEELQDIDLLGQRQKVEDAETVLEAAKDYREEILDGLRSSVRPSVESYIDIHNSQDDIKAQIADLRATVRTDIQTINNATRREELPRQVSNYQQYRDVDQFLRENDHKPIGIDELERDVQNILSAAESWHGNDSSGILSSVASAIAGNDQSDQDRYIEISGLIDDDLFQLSEWDAATFHCEFNEDKFEVAETHVDSARETALNNIKNTIHQELENSVTSLDELEHYIEASDEYKVNGDFKDILNEISTNWSNDDWDLQGIESTLNSEDDVNSAIRALSADENTVSQILEQAFVKPIEEFHSRQQTILEQKQNQEKKYERLHNIISTESATFVHILENVETPDQIGKSKSHGEDDFAHTKEIVTQERGKLLGRDDIADANLWESPDEPVEIHNTLMEFINRLSDSRYTALNEGTIKGGSEPGYSYGEHRVFSVLMSRAFEETDQVQDRLLNNDGGIRMMKDEIDDRIYFPKQEDKYGESIVPFGAEWDISLTIFVGSVFLDNLAPVDNYKEKYDEERSQKGEDILVRHTHGVDGRDKMGMPDDGAYVFRENLVNLRTEEVSVFTSEDVDTTRKLKDEYEKVIGFEYSRIDLESD
jgi:hypothetical protein